MPVTPAGRHRLATLAKERRFSRRLTKDQAAVAGDMAVGTWTRIEDGQSVRDLTLAGVDAALEWTPGSALRVASEEGDPIEVQVVITTPDQDQMDASLQAALARLSGFPVGRGLDALAEGLTDEQIEAVKVIIRGMRGK